MQFDVVQEVRAQGEAFVSSRLKQDEGEADDLKRDLKALTNDRDERLGKLQQYALDSILESGRMRHASVLKEWTGKARATIIFDSTVDEFTKDSLFKKVKGKRNVAVIGTTTAGDVFGGFYSVAVTKQDRYFKDPNMFAFSFESHGRCKTPQRFGVKKENKGDAVVNFYKDDFPGRFVEFYGGGGGCFYLGNERSRTYCIDVSDAFEGLENTTLTGMKNSENFTCCHLVAIQLKSWNVL